MKVDRLVLVGLGGIGSIAAEPLVRLLAWHDDGTRRVLVIDGDKYEEKNRTRQLFSATLTGESKARAWSARLNRDLDGALDIDHDDRYAAEETFSEAFDAGGHPLIVLAVDNHATHAACLAALADAVHRGTVRNATVIRPGNGGGAAWGHVTVSAHVVREGRALTLDPREAHDEIGTPGDVIPGQGCMAHLPDEPQKLAANALAAAMAIAYVSAVLDDRPFPDEWTGELGEDAHARVAWRGGPAGAMVTVPRKAQEGHPSPPQSFQAAQEAAHAERRAMLARAATPPV